MEETNTGSCSWELSRDLQVETGSERMTLASFRRCPHKGPGNSHNRLMTPEESSCLLSTVPHSDIKDSTAPWPSTPAQESPGF